MMRRDTSMVGRLAHAPILRRPGMRRAILAVLLAICALLSLYPERYRAAMSLTPADPASLGLGGTVSQLGALNSVFGNQSALEVSIKVARSPYVRTKVAERLKLEQRLGMTRVQVLRWLEKKVDIRSLRGGIIQFEAELGDAELGRKIVGAFGDAVREQLGASP